MAAAAGNGSYDLEQGVFNAVPGLVAKALGPARKWFNGALEWICGDPETLKKTGQKYVELGQNISTLSLDLQGYVDGVPSWQGPAATQFRSTMATTVDVVNKVGGFIASTNEILTAAAEIAVEAANMIWDIVVELVTWLVKTLIKALASSTFSFGATIAAWFGAAIGQITRVVTSVMQIVNKVGGFLQKIWALIQKVMQLIQKYKAVLEKVKAILQKIKDLSARAGKVGDGSATWEEYKANPTSGGPNAVGANFSGQGYSAAGLPSGGVEATSKPWEVGADTGPRTGSTTPEYQYEGGYRPGQTHAAGIDTGTLPGSQVPGGRPVIPDSTVRPVIPDGTGFQPGSYQGGYTPGSGGSRPGGAGGGAGGAGGGGYSYGGGYSAGSGGYQAPSSYNPSISSFEPSVETRAASLGGYDGGTARELPGSSGAGGAGGGSGINPVRPGTGAAGIGGMSGGGGAGAAGLGMMPMAPGGAPAQPSARTSSTLGRGETPLAAGTSPGGPSGAGAPMPMMGAGANKKDNKRGPEGKGVVMNARLGEDHDEEVNASPAPAPAPAPAAKRVAPTGPPAQPAPATPDAAAAPVAPKPAGPRPTVTVRPRVTNTGQGSGDQA